jgi:hypothetical protein
VSENVFSEDFSGASVASYAASDLTFLPADKSVRVSASCSQVVITLWPSDELNRRQVQSARIIHLQQIDPSAASSIVLAHRPRRLWFDLSC